MGARKLLWEIFPPDKAGELQHGFQPMPGDLSSQQIDDGVFTPADQAQAEVRKVFCDFAGRFSQHLNAFAAHQLADK
jgi:hypothetical protein